METSDLDEGAGSAELQIFICYRRIDGRETAELLYELLNGHTITRPDGESVVANVYLDTAAPAVSNWKEYHLPSLQRSKAFLTVLTPGLYSKVKDDEVHRELDWWLKNRDQAPILIDTTGEGDRWMPPAIKKKWPDAQRIDLNAGTIANLDEAKRTDQLALIEHRIITGILASEEKTVYEDLERLRSLTKRQRRLLVSVSFAVVIAAGLAAKAFMLYLDSEALRKVAESRRLATNAATLISTRDNLDLAMLLSVEANRITETYESRHSLIEALESNPRIKTFLSIHETHVPVRAVAFHPARPRVATEGSDNTVLLWNLEYPGQPMKLVGHDASVSTIAFSSGGNTLASGDHDGRILLWDMSSYSPLGPQLTEHEAMIEAIAFGPNDETLVTASADGKVLEWDLSTQTPRVLSMTQEARLSAFAISGDGVGFVTGSSQNNYMSAWSVPDAARFNKVAGPSRVSALAYSPDNGYIVSGHGLGEIVIWDIKRGQSITLRAHTLSVTAIAFHPSGRLFATAAINDEIAIWELQESSDGTSAIKAEVLSYPAGFWSLDFDSDGELLVAGTQKGFAVVWHMESPGFPSYQEFDGHTGAVKAVAFDPTGVLAASAGEDTSVFVWNVDTLQPAADTLRGHTRTVRALEFSPDGRILASGSEDSTIRLWDVESMTEWRAPLSAHQTAVNALSFRPDGTILASAGDDPRILLWDLESGEIVRELLLPARRYPNASHTFAVNDIDFSPDGKVLAAGLGDDIVALWDVNSGLLIAEPLHHPPRGLSLRPGVGSVAFHPDGGILASGSFDFSIMLWDLESLEPTGPLTDPKMGMVGDLSFSPDGWLLVVPGFSIVLWELSPQGAVGSHVLGRHIGAGVTAVAVGPGGQTILSGSSDGRVLIWDVDFEGWRERACSVANRNMSLDEWSRYFPVEPYRATCPGVK